MPQPKVCCRCKEAKPLGAFHLSKRTADGRDPRCRDCRRLDTAKSPKQPQRSRANTLLKTYGITVEQYDRMLVSQAGVCAICHKPESMGRLGVTRNLCVDHDHITGKVRGLLCASCNFAIGKLGDDPETIRSAAEYLIAAAEDEARESVPPAH